MSEIVLLKVSRDGSLLQQTTTLGAKKGSPFHVRCLEVGHASQKEHNSVSLNGLFDLHAHNNARCQ